FSASPAASRAAPGAAAAAPAASGSRPSTEGALCWRTQSRLTAAEPAPAPPAGRIETASSQLLLASDHEVRAPVLGPAPLVMPRIEWKFLAIADRPQPVGGDAERDQI